MPAYCLRLNTAPQEKARGRPVTPIKPHIERFNNILRQRLARFVRKTLSFSKCDMMHETCLRMFLHEYNKNKLHNKQYWTTTISPGGTCRVGEGVRGPSLREKLGEMRTLFAGTRTPQFV